MCAYVLFGRIVLSLILEAPPLQGLMIDDENLKLKLCKLHNKNSQVAGIFELLLPLSCDC